MRAADRVLVVMAKAPRAGRVKTRLSNEYPDTVVVELYRCLLQDTLTRDWFDVDLASDLARLAEALGRDPSAAPRTAAYLRSWPERDRSQAPRASGSDPA